jgi:hypothetical protein
MAIRLIFQGREWYLKSYKYKECFTNSVCKSHRGEKMIDFDKALLDPALVFNNPADVLHSRELSRSQKIQILQRWEYDVRELQVAEEESMRGPQSVTLDVVLNALRALGAEPKDRSAPTKHGGK